MEWIQSQMNALSISNAKPSYGSNIYVEQSVQEQLSNCEEVAMAFSGQIMDPRCSQTNGAPRKFRKKGPLETSTKKARMGSSKSSKGKGPRQNIVQDAQAFDQAFSTRCTISRASTNNLFRTNNVSNLECYSQSAYGAYIWHVAAIYANVPTPSTTQ